MKEILLTRGKVAFVDDDDYEQLAQFKWHASTYDGRWYAERNLPNQGRSIRMHKVILPGYDTVDHKNGNGLDNQKNNLRPATDSQNAANSRPQIGRLSRYKGVSRHKKRWRAYIKVNYKYFHLGNYSSEEDAAIAYNRAAQNHFGEFARINIL